jgi:hypothetical protein
MDDNELSRLAGRFRLTPTQSGAQEHFQDMQHILALYPLLSSAHGRWHSNTMAPALLVRAAAELIHGVRAHGQPHASVVVSNGYQWVQRRLNDEHNRLVA